MPAGSPVEPRTSFRRTTPQITNPGGLWDESQNFYPRLGGIPHLGAREWRWSRGSGQHPGDHLLAEDASALARRSGAE